MKMTDNDIIKALECCGRDGSGFDLCVDCPYDGVCVSKEQHMPRDAVNLIKRQKEEIERLLKSLNLTQQEQYKNGRKDAIKEFSDRLKKSLERRTEPIDEYDIDNTVEEMTEENKNG